MIEKIEEESLYIDELSELFPKILTSKSVKEDIKNKRINTIVALNLDRITRISLTGKN